MARAFLLFYALLFLSFGVFAFLNPDILQEIMGASEMTTDGIFEIRSNYGGVSFGIGSLCFLSLWYPDLQRPAMFTLLAYSGGYALGRFAALPFNGTPGADLLAYTAFEAVTALLTWLLLRRKFGQHCA